MSDEITDLTDKLRQAVHIMEADADRGRERDQRLAEIERRVLGASKASGEWRTPSKAGLIGPGFDPNAVDGIRGGDWINALLDATDRDAEKQAIGKAVLAEFGSRHAHVEAKATLGDTDAAGGYLIPSRVANVSEAAGVANPLRSVLSVVRMGSGSATEVPLAGTAPTRAEVVARGATKPNENLALGNYTATLYTIARIYDIANQLLRQSAGAAEQLVLSQGIKSIAHGEAHYILNGTGTNEPKGLITSLDAMPAGYTTTHTASDSTVAGSVRAAFVKAVEALADRNYQANAIVANPGDVAHGLLQGDNTAGFWTDSVGEPLGLRIVQTTAVPTGHAIVGDFTAATLFVGEDMRVDRSGEAGDRWDKNLMGFRFEEEIAFNADPYVMAGGFQLIEGLIP